MCIPSSLGGSGGHKRINFASSSWADIGEALIGIESEIELRGDASVLLGRKIHSFERLIGGGNSRAYKIIDEKNDLFFLKEYPDLSKDKRKRQLTEFNACNFFKLHGIDNVAQVENLSNELNITLFKWIVGDAIEGINKHHIDMAVLFVRTLFDLSQNTSEDAFQAASQACLSIAELKSQIDSRLSELLKVSNQFSDLNLFLIEDFLPLKKQIYAWLEGNDELTTSDSALAKSMKILSPADFGFHNAIIQNEDISWIDFEYFGWDDPVKLVAEFIIHPAMELHEDQKIYWIDQMIEIFEKSDSEFKHRLNVSWPLYILRWSLIVLNVYSDNLQQQRSLVKKVIDSSEANKKRTQLQKAQDLLSQFLTHGYECPYILERKC